MYYQNNADHQQVISTVLFHHVSLNIEINRSNDAVNTRIKGIKWTTGSTYTHLALEEVLKTGFTNSAGARGDVPHIVIVVTDGWSIKPHITSEVAAKIKEENAVIFTIGKTEHERGVSFLLCTVDPWYMKESAYRQRII